MLRYEHNPPFGSNDLNCGTGGGWPAILVTMVGLLVRLEMYDLNINFDKIFGGD